MPKKYLNRLLEKLGKSRSIKQHPFVSKKGLELIKKHIGEQICPLCKSKKFEINLDDTSHSTLSGDRVFVILLSLRCKKCGVFIYTTQFKNSFCDFKKIKRTKRR